jgi:hypothetical protein
VQPHHRRPPLTGAVYLLFPHQIDAVTCSAPARPTARSAWRENDQSEIGVQHQVGSPLILFFSSSFQLLLLLLLILVGWKLRVQIGMELQMLHPFSGMELLTHLHVYTLIGSLLIQSCCHAFHQREVGHDHGD